MSDEKAKETDFDMQPVETKPPRKYRKGSKYDIVLETFIKGSNDLVKIQIVEKDANYIRTQLTKRIVATKLTDKIAVSVVNETCYLEKVKPETKEKKGKPHPKEKKDEPEQPVIPLK